MNAAHLAQRADTARSPGLTLTSGHPHAVQRCRDVLVRPPASHAAYDGQRLLRCMAAVLAGSRLADAQLGMLTALPVDDEHDLTSLRIDIYDDLSDQRPYQSLARPHSSPRRLPCR